MGENEEEEKKKQQQGMEKQISVVTAYYSTTVWLYTTPTIVCLSISQAAVTTSQGITLPFIGQETEAWIFPLKFSEVRDTSTENTLSHPHTPALPDYHAHCELCLGSVPIPQTGLKEEGMAFIY